MRIGVLTTSYPRDRGDYAGLFVRGAARALAARGHRVEVLAPEPAQVRAMANAHPRLSVTHVAYARPRGLQQTFYGAGAPENVGEAPWRGLGVMSYAAALAVQVRKRRARWDAVMSHWALPCGLVAAAAAPELPHLAVCHSADVHALTHPSVAPVNRRLRNWLVNRHANFWFVSERQRTAFLASTALSGSQGAPGRVHVGSMGLDRVTAADELAVERAKARRRWGLERFTALALGRLVPIKGLSDAILAMASVPGAELWLAGDGPDGDRLAQLAAQHGVQLRAPGIVSGLDKHSLLHAADVLLVPSRVTDSGRSEGFPTVINEAHAAGLPVIATRVGGITESLQDGHNALLTDPASPAELAAAIARLRADPELAARLSQAGQARAKGLLWSTLAPTLERLLSANSVGGPEVKSAAVGRRKDSA